MKNYYEILQIDKKASQEIIEKVYKILVKKYHPDLQPKSNKLEAEQKIKIINEAYEILSDPIKRQNYDLSLKNTFINIEDYNNIVHENNKLKNEIKFLKLKHQANNNYNNINSNLNNQNINNNNYYYSENNHNFNKNYNIHNDLSFFQIIKSLLKNLFILIISILIILFIIQIPFIKNILFDFDNSFGIMFFLLIIILIYYFKK